MTPTYQSLRRTLRKFALPLLLLAITQLMCACHTREWKTRDMTPFSPRLQTLFEKTDTVCFGRFLVHVPAGTTVAWGAMSVGLGVVIYPGESAKLTAVIQEREEKLKTADRFPTGSGLKLYRRTIDGAQAGQKTIVSYEDFDSIKSLRINSYYALGSDLIAINARTMVEDESDTIRMMNDIAKRLRSRADDELPTEPGVCLERTFLPDLPSRADRPEDIEHIQAGFRLKELPDVHLSIHTAPANDNPESDSLKRQFNDPRERAQRLGTPAPYADATFFREAPRTIRDWTTGYEVLARNAGSSKSPSSHEFFATFVGVPNDALRPYADIRLTTGVQENQSSAVEPSVDDAEAIALWDRLIGSIRLRPTGAEARKTSDAGAVDRHAIPLGTAPVAIRRPRRMSAGGNASIVHEVLA